jgi:hypothetical protein
MEAGFETGLGSFACNVMAGKGGMKVCFATPKRTAGGVRLQHPASDAAATIRDIEGDAGHLVVTLTGKPSGRVEVDGLNGGKDEVQMVLTA